MFAYFTFWSATHLLNSRHQQLGILQESFPAAPESLRLKRAALVAEMVAKNRDRNQCANSQNRLSKSGGRSSHTHTNHLQPRNGLAGQIWVGRAPSLLLNAFPTPFPYSGFLHLAQARFLMTLSTVIAACALGLSLKALILSAMEEVPQLILAIDLGVFFMV